MRTERGVNSPVVEERLSGQLQSQNPGNLKGLRRLPPTPADSRIFGFSIFRKMLILGNFPMGFGVREGLQWMGNGCGLQMDGFSAHFDSSESIFDDVHDFDDFAFLFGRQTLFPEGPRTLRECPEGTGTL